METPPHIHAVSRETDPGRVINSPAHNMWILPPTYPSPTPAHSRRDQPGPSRHRLTPALDATRRDHPPPPRATNTGHPPRTLVTDIAPRQTVPRGAQRKLLRICLRGQGSDTAIPAGTDDPRLRSRSEPRRSGLPPEARRWPTEL
ncbi:hypothetical protein Asp14428_47250 [Actinoplanes sp. NBRC 14428]|nr:hypothetical protein Asp14428_47250 [Actinoplanes sp. NBRC 14428]